MSLKSELQEVVDWLSDRSAESDPAPQPVYSKNWDDAKRNLATAEKTFTKVVAALEMNASPSLDFARDLEHQTESLKLHAQLQARRAQKTPTPSISQAYVATANELAEKKKALDEAKKKLAEVRMELDERKKELDQVDKDLEAAKKPAATAATSTAPDPADDEKASDLVRSASGSLETAHENLLDGIEHPDPVADAFANELELLSEMTVSLRLQLEADERAPKKPKSDQELVTPWKWTLWPWQ